MGEIEKLMSSFCFGLASVFPVGGAEPVGFLLQTDITSDDERRTDEMVDGYAFPEGNCSGCDRDDGG